MKGWITLCALLQALIAIAQSNSLQLRKEIEKIIRYDTNIPMHDHKGFIVGVIDRDSTYIVSFTAEESNLSKILPQDKFQLGGLSKVITALLLEHLDKEEFINLEDSINDYLPIEYQNPNLEISWLDLLTHRSSLPKQPAGIGAQQPEPNNPYAHYSNRDVLQFYRNYQGGKKNFVYSHYNYALLEATLQVHFGSADSLFTEVINNRFRFDSITLNPSILSIGYDRTDSESATWTFRSYQLSQGISSNLEGLLKFLKYQISDHSLDGLHEPIIKTGMRNALYITKGWYVLRPKRWYNVYTHAGTTDGHKAYMGFVKETQTGVVLLSRSNSEINDLGLLILRMINHTWKRKANDKKIKK